MVSRDDGLPRPASAWEFEGVTGVKLQDGQEKPASADSRGEDTATPKVLEWGQLGTWDRLRVNSWSRAE